MARPAARTRSTASAARLLPVLSTKVLEPWLGREMAAENQVERFLTATLSRFQEDQHPSIILRTRAESPKQRLGELYDEMLVKDADLAAIVTKRSDAVSALPQRIVPELNTPEAMEVAQLCEQWRLLTKGLDTAIASLLMSRGKGVQVVELTWDVITRGPLVGAIVPVALFDRPMWRFAFKQGELHVRQPNGKDPIPAPPGKFLVMRHGSADTAWGLPLLDRVYWPWFVKKHVIKWWAHFVEKWAAPTAIGTYKARRAGAGANEDVDRMNAEQQAKLLGILNAIQTNFTAALPEGMDIKLLEAVRSGSVSYGEFAAECTRAMARVFLGEINTSGLRPGTGSYASEEVSNSIRYEKVELDAYDLSGGVLRDQLLRWIAEVNFGPEASVPAWVFDIKDAQDREELRKGIELLARFKLPITRRHVYMVANASEPREGEETVTPPAAPVAPPAAPAPVPPPPPAANDDAEPAAREAAATGGRTVRLAEEDLADELATAEARDEELSAIALRFRGETLAYYERHQELVLEAWDEDRFSEGDGLRWLVDRLDPDRHGRVLETAQLHAIGLGIQHLVADGISVTRGFWVPGTQLGARAPGQYSRSPLPIEPANEATLAEAVTPQTAIDHWARLLGIPRSVFDQLADENRRFAFTVAGITDATLLLKVQALTQRAAVEGWTRDRFRAELAAVYERHGVSATSSWHADLIYQQNVRQANAAIRYQQTVGNPAAHGLIPYLMWATLGDDRVRARPEHNHAVMHEKVFATSHPIWFTWWNPAGFGCRCYVGIINRAKAQRLGLTGAEPTGPWPTADGGRALPDPGFRGSPTMSAASSDLTAKLVDLFEEARRAGSTDLLAALEQLFSALGMLQLLAGLAGGGR